METARQALEQYFDHLRVTGSPDFGGHLVCTFRLFDVQTADVERLRLEVESNGYAVRTESWPGGTFRLFGSKPVEQTAASVASCYEYFAGLAKSNPPATVGAIEFSPRGEHAV